MQIREIRKKHSMSQSELAAMIGVTQPTMSSWESGEQSPTLKNCLLLAEALGCSLNDIVGTSAYEVPVNAENGVVIRNKEDLKKVAEPFFEYLKAKCPPHSFIVITDKNLTVCDDESAQASA